jgi:hypothetical protein
MALEAGNLRARQMEILQYMRTFCGLTRELPLPAEISRLFMHEKKEAIKAR